jgi:chemotaxis protein methyltransferase CheR
MTTPAVIPPTLPSTPLAQVTDSELKKFADLIYDRTGIRVSPQKKTLLSNRLRRRLRQTEIDTFGEYFKHLKDLHSRHPEWDAFLQEITTHETYLFRDEAQWDWFRKVFLPEIAAEARSSKRGKKLRIWSAACSTGDEAYTMACCIASNLTNYSQWDVKILGTDIGIGAVEQAQTGVFGERAMRLVSADDRRRHFTQAKDANVWQAKPQLSKLVAFRQHNLMDPMREPPFDLVVLKNVLIYFDPTSKKKVIDNVRAAIRPGGLLLAGAAEGVADMVRDFGRIHPWLYRKPT